MKYNPYSFSRISLFEQCKFKFKLNYIDQLGTFSPSVATERGSYIHELFENHTKNKPTNFKFHLLNEIQQFQCYEVYERFINSNLGKKYMKPNTEAEVEFGMKIMNSELVNCDYNDEDAIFRGKIDHKIKEDKIYLLDWKTGKVNLYPQPLQLVMYSIWAFQEYDIDDITACFVYVEHLEEKCYNFKREHLPLLKKKLLEKVINIENESSFDKRESPLCNYCEFRSNGLCEPVSQDEFLKNIMQKTQVKRN